MNTNFLFIIKRIISEQGESILAEPRKLKGWISDYAKDEPKAERLAFGRCIEYGAYTELKNASAENRPAVKNRLAQKLHHEEGLDTTLCAEALVLLEAAEFGIPEPKILCQNCGKELQQEWEICPYCGTHTEDADTIVPEPAASSSPGVGYGIHLVEPPTASKSTESNSENIIGTIFMIVGSVVGVIVGVVLGINSGDIFSIVLFVILTGSVGCSIGYGVGLIVGFIVGVITGEI
jgi:hypothetical protein